MKNRIRIITTTDLHGYIFPYRYSDGFDADMGIAKCATLIQSLRDDNTIVIENGDVLEGSPLSYFHFHQNPKDIHPIAKAIKKIGYDYVNLGNHDFNYGEDAINQYLDYIEAPCITSNLYYKGKPFGPTYVIREIAGKKIALFALVTHYVPHWEQPENIKNYEFFDAFETAKKTVTLLKDLEHPDYIIGIYHGGFERDFKTGIATEELTGENQGYQMLKEIPGLDVLITGHQHRSYVGEAFGTVYTQCLDSGREISLIDIYTDTNTIEPHVLPVDTPADEEILALVQKEEDACQKWLDTSLGDTLVDLYIEDEFQARLNKSQVITFLNLVQKEISGADICSNALFLGATGFNSSITMRDLVSTYVFPNTLVVKKITGKILKEYLEKDAEFWSVRNDSVIVNPMYDFPHPQHYNYDMLDGIEYTIKASNDVGSRITKLTRNGVPIQDEDEFTICINNYRAAGGGGFEMLKNAPTVKEIQKNVVEIIADYIQNHPEISFEEVHNIEVIK
ncbi:MAG: bifunctional metallophosphatase/5'-nucleotidase [Solobacterium sp.]|nr:bifunctional metallophosphatase/5'-nucleotidase [Solobacterium sp.]